MLDPHIRAALPPVSGSPGKYSVTFRVPDRHGVFKFIIDYKRKGCVLSFSPYSCQTNSTPGGLTLKVPLWFLLYLPDMTDTRVSSVLRGLIMLALSVQV
jgi:hypothetical protein